MTPELRDRLAAILERPHRLGMIGGDLDRQLDHCQAFLAVINTVVPANDKSTSDIAADSGGTGGSTRDGAMADTRAESPALDVWGLDLGTGGGIPGIALAAARPDMRWALLDSRTSRAAEVERGVARAGMQDRVEVLAAPAQEVAHQQAWRQRFDLVVARSFGPPSFTAECAAGFLRLGGSLVVSEPPGDDATQQAEPRWDEHRWNEQGLAACGLALRQIHTGDGARFAHIERIGRVSEDLPRLPPRSDRGWHTTSSRS